MEILKGLQGAGGAPVPLAYSEEPSRLLMSYLGKETLADVLSAQRSPKQLLQLSLKLAEAVAAVHAAGIVHCDLKPTNVMVQLRGAAGAPSVHVIDFGLALAVGQCHPASGKGRHSWYCACVHQGTPVTEKCDVVGVGVMLGFVAESMLKAAPAALQALAERAQRPEHEQRPTVQEIAEALKEMLRLC
ncbi:mitogen-activated protein kinase kinase kinase 7-like [Penaeus vannamei]|uniref:mitogen-activated protein kinase kinase kinase 7-like n=1 Tax=Penaeus vannamei TaxID=6689 RepID=UPI00387F5A18